MSGDYISRQDAIDKLDYLPIEWRSAVINTLTDMPSADVRENVKGSLIEPYLEEYYGEWYHCSVCGSNMQGGNFCNECGAELRGGEDG